MDIIGMRF